MGRNILAGGGVWGHSPEGSLGRGPVGCFGPLVGGPHLVVGSKALGGAQVGCFGPFLGGAPLIGGEAEGLAGMVLGKVAGFTGGVALGPGIGSVYALPNFGLVVSAITVRIFCFATSISSGVMTRVPFSVYQYGGFPIKLFQALSWAGAGSGMPCFAAAKLSSKKMRNPNNPTKANMNTFATDSKPE